MDKLKILVVEDDPHILIGLEAVLTGEGFAVVPCRSGSQAIDLLNHHKPALVILDIMLPGMSGYDVCKKIRAAKLSVPVLMLTAKSQEIDKVIGLELGADDYVTKPFGVRELTARVHALLRRTQTKTAAFTASLESFKIGKATINPKTFQILRNGVPEEISAKELKILQMLHHSPGEVFSREKLLTEVWGFQYMGTTRTLDQVIVQLRKKIEITPAEPKHLLTVHGVGYKLLP
ncbi:MAG: yycF 4 [Verrucomicrobiales bacterium]|nr:yycF 4 [Verrucomicrobiales bacterium]